MKSSKLVLLALLPLALGVAKLQGWCEHEPNFLSIVNNQSKYDVYINSALVGSGIKYNTSKATGYPMAIGAAEIKVYQQTKNALLQNTNTNVYVLRDSGNGLRVSKDGADINWGHDIQGCNMYVEITYNNDGTSAIVLRSGSDAKVELGQQGIIQQN